MINQDQPLSLRDFSGGIVDSYVNAQPNRGQVYDNVNPQENLSLLSRPGSELDSYVDPQIPAGAQQVRTLINYNFDEHLIVQSGKRFYVRNPVSYAILLGPTGNNSLSDGDVDSIVSHSQWNGHLLVTNNAFSIPQKIIKTPSGFKCVNAGLPKLASDPVITPGILGGTRHYLYAFVHAYTYKIGDEEFQDRGAPRFVEVGGCGDPAVNPNAISAIPVLSNGLVNNYDVTNIKIEIYRTVDEGTAFYYVGQVTNGTLIYSDTMGDAVLVDSSPLYTEGGVVDFDAPPRAKYVHIVQNRAYYGHVKEGSEILKADYLQSIDNDIDAVPATFRDTVEDELTGISSVREIPIILCKKKIYRVEGSFDLLGRNGMTHIRIHDSAGCISHNSCVPVEQGMFWCGNDGVYFTDGASVKKVSDHLNATYKNIIKEMSATGDLERITGTYDPINRRIFWSAQKASTSLENDFLLCLELRPGVSEQMSFYTWSGYGDSFRPSALTYYKDKLYRGDTRGYVLYHDEALDVDPKITLLRAENQWSKCTILWDFRSISSNFGTDFVRKWVPRLLFSAKNKSNITVQISAVNDDGIVLRNLAEIRYRGNFIWGDAEFTWGNDKCVWNSEGMIEELRRFPARGLRCSYMQLRLTNSYTIVANSDTIGRANVDSVAKTATLDLSAPGQWPDYCEDYYIYFEADGYQKGYLIDLQSGTTLRFIDALGSCPSGLSKWILKGYRKQEVLNLLSLTVHYALLSKTHSNFSGENTGANA